MAQPIDYFSEDLLRHDLKGKTVRGGVATTAAQVGLGIMNLATIPILARLLEPSDFGLVAMVTVLTGFAAMFVDAGLAMATVQREKITHQQVSNLFWLATLLGTGVAAIVAALSPAIAWFYGEPRLVAITLALAVSFVLSGLTIQHRALMRRAMQFQRLTVVQIVASAVGHIVAIAVAWQLRNYWALVARPLVTTAVLAVGTWLLCRWRPSLPRRGAGVRDMAYFGVNLAGFNVINYLARNVDYMLIGWWWGAAPLGFYERAYRLLMLPIQQINMPIAAVAIPSLSRLQNEPKKYVRAYEAMLGKLVYASGALIGLMMVTADWIVVVVFGEQWLESIPIFQWLSLVAVRQMFINTTGWLFISQGRSRELFQWACIGTPIIIASFVIGLPYGPTGVAMSYAILPSIVSPPILFWMLGRSGPMSASDLWKFFLHAVHIPVVVGTVAGVVRWILQPESEILGLLVIAPVAALTALILMLATCYGRRQLREAIDMLRQIRVQKR